ncbi:hypothetical protein SEVIR_9G087200v4 [Setaria viridis]|uniref:Uncharacterized protein n=1 Tax=Setaria viridis TaxID=4556 RepID=A0A4V6Y7N5_SETVI|nr:hypothetical protein SEVIR_9G087200v2 [Setaria viridis]
MRALCGRRELLPRRRWLRSGAPRSDVEAPWPDPSPLAVDLLSSAAPGKGRPRAEEALWCARVDREHPDLRVEALGSVAGGCVRRSEGRWRRGCRLLPQLDGVTGGGGGHQRPYVRRAG